MNRRRVLTGIVLMTAAGALGSGAAPRQRVLLDAGWRFYRGAIPGATLTAGGLPVPTWRSVADEAGRTDAAQMAAPDLDTSGGNWKDAKTGDDTFHGQVGSSSYRTTLPQVSGAVPATSRASATAMPATMIRTRPTITTPSTASASFSSARARKAVPSS
jgi:hypothetical protein